MLAKATPVGLGIEDINTWLLKNSLIGAPLCGLAWVAELLFSFRQ